jgi:sulfide dehydrogenase cytochrome subunit
MARLAIKLGLLAAVGVPCLTSETRAADGTAVVAICANCHGQAGASTDPTVPIIGGVSAPYVVDTLAAYKNRERPCPPTEVRAGDKKGTKTDMCAVAKDLSQADIKEIAAHLAGQKFVRATQIFDPALAQKGARIHQQSCQKCHSRNGSVAEDDSGILAGQWMPYLKKQLVDYGLGVRQADPKKRLVIQRLDQAAFDALVNYYASVK